MRSTKKVVVALVVLITSCVGYNTNKNQQQKANSEMRKKEINAVIPTADQFVTSPLRCRIKLELNAPVSEVWSLVGNPTRMPDYSEGLLAVDAKSDRYGNCQEFICYFKPLTEGEEGIRHRSVMKWYEVNTGWAAVDEEPNQFGLTQSLALVTLNNIEGKTELTWDMHFNASGLKAYLTDLEEALNKDISKRLINKFGGKVLEDFNEGRNL